MSKSSFDNFLKTNVGSKIVKRGQEYFENGNIEQFTEEKNVYKAKVKGSGWELYQVEIGVSNEGDITSFSCDCPYDDHKVCKHTVAVILNISKDTNLKPTKKKKSARTVESIIENASREELNEFVLNMSNKYKEFEVELRFNICDDFEEELAGIKKYYSTIKRQNTYRGYINYSSCNNICSELDLVIKKVEKHIEKQNYLNALMILSYLLVEEAKLASTADDGSGYLSELINKTLKLIKYVVNEVFEAKLDKKETDKILSQMFKLIKTKALNGWGFEFDLLLIATTFVNKKNNEKFHKILNELESGNDFNAKYYQAEIQMIKYRIIGIIDGDDVALQFANDNINIDEFRVILINNALKEKNYNEAEKLCLEKIDFNKIIHYHCIDKWKNILCDIYNETNNAEGKIKVLRSIFLDGYIETLDILKEIFQRENKWEQEYPKLLKDFKNNKDNDSYLKLLARENEIDMLMKEVVDNQMYIFDYSELLYNKYMDKVKRIYIVKIWENMSNSSERNEYKKVAVLIKKFYDLGEKEESMKLVNDLKAKFPKRMAMIDELNKIKMD